MRFDYRRRKKRKKKKRKARCPFNQLLCVEFDVIFEVDADIDEGSIEVTCAN